MRILAVDDDTVNRLVMGGFLRRMKETYACDYDLAGNGMEAVRMCVKQKYDLIFMDVMMPEMDGIEAVKCIRQVYERNGWEHATIVMVTACDDIDTRKNSRDAGAIGYLNKPVKSHELVDWVQLAIFGRKSGSDEDNVGKSGDIGLTD